MGSRHFPLVTNHYYHVMNRGVEHRITFSSKREFQRALLTMAYYQYLKPEVKYSYFLKYSNQEKAKFIKNLKNNHTKLVDVICFCFMPNHFHFLLKQNIDGGISKFMGNFQNSYAKYFNIRNDRDGSLFRGNFKSVLVETDVQLIHLSRYIHLNPYTSAILSSYKGLIDCQWSSFGEYLGVLKSNFCDKDIVLNQFKNSKSYRMFVLDNADYQRRLKGIRDLILE